jgi:ADP-ribose pyrophosphatase YjhB (NUDIX family)
VEIKPNYSYPIRTSSKAIIIENNSILVIHHNLNGRIFSTLPGGGQNLNESLVDSLKRECLEETGYAIEVGKLVFVRDYISNHHEFKLTDPNFHQVEFFFEGKINTIHSRHALQPDIHQIGVEWLALETLEYSQLFPKFLRTNIIKWLQGETLDIYLGDVN